MKFYEILTTDHTLIIVKSKETINVVGKKLHDKYNIIAHSYIECDINDIEESDVTYII